MVVVQTEAPSLSSEQVEALVTRPLETALNGRPQLAAIRSESIQGLSAITLTFDDRADIYRVRQLASERINEAAAQLPAGVKAPKMVEHGEEQKVLERRVRIQLGQGWPLAARTIN